MHQPKAGSRLSPYGENSPNAWRYILRNNRGHKVIVWIGWRVFVTIVALNCMHIYRRRVLVYHPLPSCAEEGWAWCGFAQSKQSWMRCIPKQVEQHGPATVNLEHRAKACYMPCGFDTMNFVMPLAYTHSWVPPLKYWNMLHNESIKAYIIFKQKQTYFAH